MHGRLNSSTRAGKRAAIGALETMDPNIWTNFWDAFRFGREQNEGERHQNPPISLNIQLIPI
jgi:hypothetical protein